jgi:Flp pilus assembly pilin Flp
MNTIKKFLQDESGLELSEYAVATALIVAALILALTNLAGSISDRLAEVKTKIDAIN